MNGGGEVVGCGWYDGEMSEYGCVRLGGGWDSSNVMGFRSLGETTGPVFLAHNLGRST